LSLFDVSLIDASGQKPPVNLTRSGFHAVEPLFSPDGQAVYYQSARDGLQTAWEPELDDLASRTVRITPFSSSVQAFKIAPDGQSLVLVSVSPLSGMTGYKIPLGPRGTWLIAPRLPALGRAEGAVCLQRANADSKPPRSGTNPGTLCQATSTNRSPGAVWRGPRRERGQYFLRAGGLVRAGRVV
jgi:dipeptidyl aminopeptidase/acylaminoacyl peptidase